MDAIIAFGFVLYDYLQSWTRLDWMFVVGLGGFFILNWKLNILLRAMRQDLKNLPYVEEEQI